MDHAFWFGSMVLPQVEEFRCLGGLFISEWKNGVRLTDSVPVHVGEKVQEKFLFTA